MQEKKLSNNSNNHASALATVRQVVLIVLDGWGYREDTTHNAIAAAKTPVFHKLWNEYPHTLLQASGLAVGLPEGQMGNSEIGHTTIGAGKIIDTDLVRIKKAIDAGDYERNPAFLSLFEHVLKHRSTLHVTGLLGDGGVHAHSEHLYAFLKAAKKAGVTKVAIHVFTDGRDTPPKSAAHYLRELEAVLAEVQIGFIATVSGRFYAMDRDNNWDRLAKVEQALFECKGNVCVLKQEKPSDAVEKLYATGVVDEYIEPIVCLDETGKGCALMDNDAVFFFNFRPDRARMLSQKFLEKSTAQNICFATMTEYGAQFSCLVAFPPINIDTTLAKEISEAGLSQAHIAETEKFPHATYFLNGGVEKPFTGEERVMLASRKDVQTHDQAPEMRAQAIADEAIQRLQNGVNFIFINFANADMVGHTAEKQAIITAVETVDTQLGRVVDSALAHNAHVLITADHGNAEINIDPVTGEKHTAHTTNPVPYIHVFNTEKVTSNMLHVQQGTLADIAPTVLHLFGTQIPHSMTGKVLHTFTQ